jgi:hypothetical protein
MEPLRVQTGNHDTLFLDYLSLTGFLHHWYFDHHFASSEVCSFPVQLEQSRNAIDKQEL